MRRRQQGNTLAEYGLPLMLVVTVMAVAISSTGLYNRMLGLFSASTNDWSGSGALAKVAPLGSPVLPLSAAMLAPPTSAEEEQVCFSSGTCINVPVTRSDTSGDLGEDKVKDLADLLDRINDQLKKMKGMEQVSNLVEQLANMGHGMGDKMREIEKICPDICDGGDEDRANELLNEIRQDRTAFEQKWQELQNFLNDPANQGLLDRFPEARAIIEQKVAEIKAIVAAIDAETHEGSKSYDCSGQTCNKREEDTGAWYKTGKEGTSFNNTEDDKVHQDSNTVCGQGGGPGCFRRKENGEWEPITPQPPATATAP